MKRKITFVVAVMVVALVAGVTGCGPLHIAMNPSSEFELEKKHIPCKITLFMDSEFQNYHWQGFSDAELRGLDYDLGSASKNLFLDAFKRVSDGVTLAESRPKYPVNDLVLVVHPRIGGFSEKHSLWIRNADYHAEITYHVTVYDKTGKIVLDNDYTARGVQMGTINVSRNYAAPAEKAMAQAIMTIIDDISKLGLPKN
jgi:hypothetical protein